MHRHATDGKPLKRLMSSLARGTGLKAGVNENPERLPDLTYSPAEVRCREPDHFFPLTPAFRPVLTAAATGSRFNGFLHTRILSLFFRAQRAHISRDGHDDAGCN